MGPGLNMAALRTELPDDEEFLDRAFERAMERIEDGGPLRTADLLEGRHHLASRVEELVALARRVAVVQPGPLPEIPGYTLLQELGRGGMGAVYLARQERLGGRAVALKVLLASAALSPRARERFRLEANAIARLRHANIVPVHDVVSADGLYAYAMEWVDGPSLAGWIDERRHGGTQARRHEGVDAVFVCRVGIAIARALHAVHQGGFMHRDVKPSNILLRRDGTPLLSDFGLVHEADSTLTQSGHFAGTAAYAPPEQLRGEHDKLDARSDVYALGVTLYHALALRLPFDGRAPAAMLRRIEAGLATPLRRLAPRVPRDLATIVGKAMDSAPARRYWTAAELADDLERLLSLQPIKARPAGLVTRTLKLARRKRGLLAAGLVSAVLTAALLVAVGVYVFFVPEWAAWHVREARLALLDPAHGNTIFRIVFWRDTRRVGGHARVTPQAFDEALQHYDAALRLAPFNSSIRDERDMVQKARHARDAEREPPTAHPRSAGLLAYLTGDVEAALANWERYELTRGPLAEPDPLVEAALGMWYLVGDQPPRAYPRLREACHAFPNVGFLTTYLAEAALLCGDLDAAESLLSAAESMPRLDPLLRLERVRADLRVAQGRDEEGERMYLSLIGASPAHVWGMARFHYAVLLESQGRRREAVEIHAYLAKSIPYGEKPQQAFVTAMDRWWASEPSAERVRHIRAALDEPPNACSLVSLLRQYARSQAFLSPEEPARQRSAGNIHLWLGDTVAPPFFWITAALLDWFSSPSLQNVSLSELADILEVQDMTLWRRIWSCPPIVKQLHAVTWSSPMLRSVIRRCVELPVDLARRRMRSTALLLAASAPGLASAQTIANLQFDVDGVWPTSDSAWAYAASGGTPEYVTYPAVSGGVLQQRAFGIPDNGTYFMDGGLSDTNSYALEVRVEILSINGPLGTFFDFADGSHRYMVYFSDDGVYLRSDAGDVFVDSAIYQMRTYRLESCAGQATLFIDGVPMATAAAPTDARNFIQIGSGCITCNPTGPTAGDADWDFLVFTQEVVLAAAAEDQTVPEGAVVTLDGSTSSSPCGTLVYHWTQLAGDPVTLDLTDPVRPTFTAPFVPMGGAVLTFTLVVSDGVNTSEPDVVNITVTNINHAPVAMAGDDLCTETAVAEGGVATLDGSNSYDEDDEPLTYAWAQTGGTPVTLDLTDPVKPTFTAPLVGVLGETLTFELTVSDGLDGSSDTVDACVDNVNHAPIADAGEPQTVNEGSAVALHAGGSSDPDGDDLSYAWTQVSGPAVTLSDDSSATPSFTAPQVGASGATLVFRVTVDDGYGGSGDDEVTITVQDTNAPPACELARPSVAELWPPNHKLVAISIGGVSDPEDGDIQITILDVTQDEPTSGLGDGDTAPDAVIQGSTVLLRAERAGGGNGRVYRITFLADDGFGGTCTGAVTVTVPHDKGKNKPPAVDDGQNYSSTGP